MSTFKQFERKRLLISTPANSTWSLLRPSRPLASLPTPASEPVLPVSQQQLEHAARFGHSLDRISILPPAISNAEMNKANQAHATDTVNQTSSTSASISSVQLSAETAPTKAHLHRDQTPRFGHSFANIPLFPTVKGENQLQTRIQAARSSGHSLDRKAQQQLEQGLGADLSRVQVHTDSEADCLSRSVNALAFTTGSDIFFRAGMYHPGSSQSLRLLAHEATHVVQQMAGPVSGVPRADGLSISDPGDRFERAAEVSADQIVKGSAWSLAATEGSVSLNPSLRSHSFSTRAASFDRRGEKNPGNLEVQDTQEPLQAAQQKGADVRSNVLQRVFKLGGRTLKDINAANPAIQAGLIKIKITIEGDPTQAVTDIRNELQNLADTFDTAGQILTWIEKNPVTVTTWLDNQGHQYKQNTAAYQEQEEGKKRKAQGELEFQAKRKKAIQDAANDTVKQQPAYGRTPLPLDVCRQLLQVEAVEWHLPPGGKSQAIAQDARTQATTRSKFTTVYEYLDHAAEDLQHYLQQKPDLWAIEEETSAIKDVVMLPTKRSGWDCNPNGIPNRRTWQKIEVTMEYRGGRMPSIQHFTPIG